MPVDSALAERVRRALAAEPGEATPARVAAALRSEGNVLGDEVVLAVTDALRAEISGAGPLEPLLREPGVTDVLVNGPAEVWVDRGGGLERTQLRLRDEAVVRRLAQRLAAGAGRRLDDAVPFVDARLANGVRLHAVLPPVSPAGTVLSLRVPARRMIPLDELAAGGSAPPPVDAWLRSVVAGRLAFLVTGGTGTGKTTVLASLLSLVDARERIVLVEDSGELRPQHPHVVRLEARPGNVEGAGRVALVDLVRQALRMRPDRIVVGEVRGAEVVDLLAALNTGHDGGCATLHANSPRDVPARLEALGVAAGLPRDAVHSQAAAALDVVLHLERDTGGRRRVAEIDVVSVVGDRIRMAPALAVTVDGEIRAGPAVEELRRRLQERGVLV